MKLKICSDYLRGRASIAELDHMPYRYIQTFYYMNFKQQLRMSKDENYKEQVQNQTMASVLEDSM